MKKYLTILSAAALLATTGCQSSDNVQEMLQDDNERRQVYTTILENEEMRNELMAMMREQNLGGPMGRSMMDGHGMVGDTTGMAEIHRQQVQNHMKQMMQLCESDAAACNEMARMMLQHQGMMASMMERMQQQGMLDSTSLQKIRSRLNQ